MPAKQELLQAIQSGNLESVKSILKQHPAWINDQTEQGIPVSLLAAYHQKMDLFHYLIGQKKELSFVEAVAAGKLEIVKKQLAASPELLHALSADGFPSIALSAYFGQEDVARFLLEQGADINQASQNHMRIAALHAAVAIQNTDLARLFLENGAEVNKPQMEGIRPLHSAAHRGQMEMVKLLLAYGADPTLATDDGRTSFDIAETEGKEEIRKILG